MTVLYILLIALLAGLFNRIGGMGGYWWANGKVRDWGVPACAIGAMMVLGISCSWWVWCIFFLLAWGALSTYNDRWWTYGIDFWEWVLTGFSYGLAALPIAISTGKYLGFAIRCGILAAFMPFSNKLQWKLFHDDTDGVEGSRGIMYILTLPLLLI